MWFIELRRIFYFTMLMPACTIVEEGSHSDHPKLPSFLVYSTVSGWSFSSFYQYEKDQYVRSTYKILALIQYSVLFRFRGTCCDDDSSFRWRIAKRIDQSNRSGTRKCRFVRTIGHIALWIWCRIQCHTMTITINVNGNRRYVRGIITYNRRDCFGLTFLLVDCFTTTLPS